MLGETRKNKLKKLHGGNVLYFTDANVVLKGDDIFRQQPVDSANLTIKGLNETSSAGSDSIALQLINDSLCFIAFYLTCTINTSIITGIFPNFWKHPRTSTLEKLRHK